MILRRFAALLAFGLVAAAAQDTPPAPEPKTEVVEVELSQEQIEAAAWKNDLRDAGTSPADYLRALEDFLVKFPDTEKRPQIERSIAQAAMDNNDNGRLIKYGEPVMQREPHNLGLVERVIRALLANDEEATSERALQYALQFENTLQLMRFQMPMEGAAAVAAQIRLNASLGKALVYQARALGNLGKLEDAAKAAAASYAANPTAEAARESGRWLARLDRTAEAIGRYAEAFTISDPDNTSRLRHTDREQLGKLYLSTHASEAGLGDEILAAYDRTADLMTRRYQKFKSVDPNYDITDPMEFTLSGVSGSHLEMASLRGKVVVLDFWATWCQPCRIQQPLYEEVQQQFADNPDVVFLNISTDNDRALVAPFLEREKWTKTAWFDDGLQQLFQVSSIPTTILIGKDGEVAGRLNGFDPPRFVEMLSTRIERLLKQE